MFIFQVRETCTFPWLGWWAYKPFAKWVAYTIIIWNGGDRSKSRINVNDNGDNDNIYCQNYTKDLEIASMATHDDRHNEIITLAITWYGNQKPQNYKKYTLHCTLNDKCSAPPSSEQLTSRILFCIEQATHGSIIFVPITDTLFSSAIWKAISKSGLHVSFSMITANQKLHTTDFFSPQFGVYLLHW